jgi:hypothetical protein
VARTASSYPARLVADVFAAAGCRPEKRGGNSITASVMLDSSGRVTNVGTLTGKASTPCLDAARTLLAAYVPEPRTGGLPEGSLTLVLPLSERFVACTTVDRGMFTTDRVASINSRRSPSSRVPYGGGVRMKAVVSASGCVQDLEVISSSHSELTWLAMRDVLDGRVDLAHGRPASAAIHALITVDYRSDDPRESEPHRPGTYTPPWLESLGYPAADVISY